MVADNQQPVIDCRSLDLLLFFLLILSSLIGRWVIDLWFFLPRSSWHHRRCSRLLYRCRASSPANSSSYRPHPLNRRRWRRIASSLTYESCIHIKRCICSSIFCLLTVLFSKLMLAFEDFFEFFYYLSHFWHITLLTSCLVEKLSCLVHLGLNLWDTSFAI